jgi:hypothetical protein
MGFMVSFNTQSTESSRDDEIIYTTIFMD